MSATGSSLKVGDQVWVKTGYSGDYEEIGIILSIRGRSNKSNAADADVDAVADGILVKYSTSGHEELVTKEDNIRPMEDYAAANGTTDASGRKLRRSGRSSINTSFLMNVDAEAEADASSAKGRSGTKKKKSSANTVSVTPSPAEVDPESAAISNASNGGDADAVMVIEDSSKPAAKTTKKRKSTATKKTGVTTNKKAKASPKAKSDNDNGVVAKESPYFAKDSKKSTNSNAADASTKQNVKADKRSSSAKKKKAPAKSRRKLILASSEEDVVVDVDNGNGNGDESKKSNNNGKAAKSTDKKKKTQAPAKKAPTKKAATKKAPTKAKDKNEPKTKKEKAASGSGSGTASAKKPKKKATQNTTNNNAEEGNQPDGNGGLNQPTDGWVVEYSKTGRATCRTCDDKIGKGEVRVGNTPLFRGKPGYMVYRHLHCAVFSQDIACAEDVQGYEELDETDYIKLAEQVDVSKEKIKEEMQEIRPDELVQKNFEGEMRSEPVGLDATLLPFQVEGFSWMRHQEVEEADCRGGILADEMGMGKTIQTIATILDNRPKLQHTKPGMKHPPASTDLKQRQSEEQLWDKAKLDWTNEMELLKVSKKMRTKKGGERAGTLVICPVIALSQWKSEIEKFTEEGTLSVCTYHGPDREKETPRELMKKYDVVLTTYQVVEADFRKMTSPNRVECPNCGGKFKIDKLPIHLKYFCGDAAERTEAQARQIRNTDREGGNGGNQRRGRGPSQSGGDGKSGDKKMMKKMETKVSKEAKKKPPAKKKMAADDEKKPPAKKKKATGDKKKTPAKKKSAKKPPKKAKGKQTTSESDSVEEQNAAASTPRAGSRRSAARKAASQISQSAAEWAPPNGDSDSDNFQSDAESSSDEGDDSGNVSSSEAEEYSSDSSSDNSALERAREKQRQALVMTKGKKKPMPKEKQFAESKDNGKKSFAKKPAKKGKGKKKFDDDSDDDYSSGGYKSEDEAENEIDMAALIQKAMDGAKNSVLHSLCWWRIVLDEAHFIKTRSSQTANAAFSLIGVHRWCLSGTPLQNRVGEFYSLVRFLRLDPMAYYCCRAKGCDCKSMHYRIVAGRCEACGHSGIQHYSHFNKYILNPIQRDGYSGDGRKAMFLLKNEVLDKVLLRRTKETKAADMELPPRLVQIKPVRLHPIEEDFYSALYTQTQSSFNDYVDSGTLLNNYAHIFDLLIRMRQSVDHPYLVVYSKKNTSGRAGLTLSGDTTTPAIANGSVDCDLCHEPPTDRVVSTCCGAAYCRACVLEYMATSSSMAASANLTCPSCREAFSIDLQARADIEDASALSIAPAAKGNGDSGSAGMPSLKELPHVATGSILRRINLADFATSSKIEALTRELVMMRQTSPGSKAIVFSQFVNMLDLIRWRLHSDPYLEDIGLGCRALHGGMNVKARDACLKDFREDNNVRVLLMSLKAGGVALNLTCANYIYLMDPWWNPAAEMQAIDRTHRLGQYRPIRAVRFIAENTVEERILQLQEKKRLVFDGTVGRDAGSLKMLTVDDMKSLFV